MKIDLLKKLKSSVVAGFTLTIVGSSAMAADVQAVRIGTSSTGSIFYIMGAAIADIVQKRTPLNATVEATGGSHATMFGINAGKVEFGMGNAYAAYSAVKGVAPFKSPLDLRLVIQGQPSYRFMLLRKDAGIQAVSDLAGKTVVGERRSLPELELILDLILKTHNVDPKSVRSIPTVNTGGAINALRAGNVHGIFIPGASRTPHVVKLGQEGLVDFLYIEDGKMEEIMKQLPGTFYSRKWKAGTIPGQTKDLNVFGLNTFVMTHARIPEDAAYNVAKGVLGNPEEFAKYHGAARLWNLERTISNFGIPFHEGAIRYFKEVGAWGEAQEKRQNELLN